MSNLITVKEARKLLSKKASDQLTDGEVEGMIDQLDFLARLAIKDYLKKREAGKLPERRS